MDEMFKALAVPLEEDLLPLSVLLRERGVPHRIVEQDGQQVLQVARLEHARVVAALYKSWRDGEFTIELSREAAELSSGRSWRAAPVTLALVALSIVGFALVYLLGSVQALALLSFIPFEIVEEQVVFGEMNGQYWRLLTPAFIHFGWLHIVFNCLWLWELGRRIELVMGHFNALMLCIVIAVVANVCQYIYGGPGLFGGMSGVVYGLLGFGWTAPWFQPAWPIRPRNAIMLLMVGWLLLCLVGFIEALGFGAIANAAHVGGLLVGCALGVVFGLKSRLVGDGAQRESDS
ncbi:MAG: rhomboid family intramembrane serine protease [Halioglobus sp.]|nr:rhomboid family intramembrane serine protease [Halioglobus sp.]